MVTDRAKTEKKKKQKLPIYIIGIESEGIIAEPIYAEGIKASIEIYDDIVDTVMQNIIDQKYNEIDVRVIIRPEDDVVYRIVGADEIFTFKYNKAELKAYRKSLMAGIKEAEKLGDYYNLISHKG